MLETSFRTLRRWAHAVETGPRLLYQAGRNSVIPLGITVIRNIRRGEISELHWNIVGDTLVNFFQDSGPVFTKIGQIMATRTDVLPRHVCLRLEALYDSQPPMSNSQLQKALKKAYPEGKPFKKFEEKSLAVGSIGQVHRAVLEDGTRVVVKIIRPGTRYQIERDLDAIKTYISILSRLFLKNSPSTRFVINKLVEDLGKGFENETDLEQEAKAIIDFKVRFANNKRIYVPECYEEYSSKDVLVMEEIMGEHLTVYRERMKDRPEETKKVADLVLKEILHQIFDEGRFHADPHGGNLIVMEDGRIGLIDFGLTGEFGKRDRRALVKAMKAFLSRDPDAVIKALLEFGNLPPDFDLDAFKIDIVEVVRKNKDTVLSELKGENLDSAAHHVEGFANDLFEVAHRHRIHIPQSAALLVKTLVTVEGVARSLDPEINLVKTSIPIIIRSLVPKWFRWTVRSKSR